MGKYYFVGVLLLICIYLLLADTFLKKQGLYISKDSQPWHFSNNPNLHKKTAGLYEFDKSPNTFFDIDIHDIDLGAGGIGLREGRLCEVFIYGIHPANEKQFDTIVNRFRQSSLSKGLNEEYDSFYGNVRYSFSSKEKGGIEIGIILGSSLSITIINIFDGCTIKRN